MHSHFFLLIVFAFFVSLVFAVIAKDDAREQLRFGALMFSIGLALRGRLFPFDFSDPLVCLEALADLGMGATYFLSKVLGYGAGDVRAVTYEYGNAFLVVAGLLNLLVVIDAYDVALGRK